jgi:hypothetical protein
MFKDLLYANYFYFILYFFTYLIRLLDYPLGTKVLETPFIVTTSSPFSLNDN